MTAAPARRGERRGERAARRIGGVIVAILSIALVAACGSPSASGSWTFGPQLAGRSPTTSAVPSPSNAPSSASPSSSPSGAPSPEPSAGTNPTWSLVATKTCPGTTFECITLAVPKDHFAAVGGPTWDVTFAIHRATKARKGTYVEITGGPGYSDIPTSDAYLDTYQAAITESFDMVYLDQRGIGLSGPIQCTKAAATYYASTARAQVPAEQASAAAAARTFASDCVAEAGVAESDLPFYATAQAVEDLEAVRDYLGVDKLELYGLSYGTQFVQTYAAAHPDHIATLLVDGPVDLTIDGPTYYVEAVRSAEDTLVATLNACTADDACKSDVAGGDELAAYDALDRQLAGGPITFDFPTATGTHLSRQLAVTDLENAAFNAIYYPSDRFLLQRAIASASKGNLVPLARLSYAAIGVDPDTLVPIVDPGYSDALYYAVECQDYAFYPDIADPDARVAAWVQQAEAAGVNRSRLGSAFYGDLPCLYWPTATTSNARPAPIVDPPYPTFVLTSTTDPATPIANAMRIFGRLSDAWFIQAVGGPHVIFAWGQACPDDIITQWLTEGTPPAARVTTCPWDLADPYVPNAEPKASAYRNALDLMTSVDDQIFNTNDFANRYDGEPLPLGCDFGGTLTYAPTDAGTGVTLDACEFTPDLALTGKGATNDQAGSFVLDVTGLGDTLHYQRDGAGGTSVSGTFNGKKVSLKGAP
jgi:pimeloyl-ACP methyl ester carboxylesterase